MRKFVAVGSAAAGSAAVGGQRGGGGAVSGFVKEKKIITSEGLKLYGHYTALSVAKSERGKGLGSRLISYLHSVTNLDGFMVNSIKNNKASIWYKKNGYQSIGKSEVLISNSFKRVNNKKIDVVNPFIFKYENT